MSAEFDPIEERPIRYYDGGGTSACIVCSRSLPPFSPCIIVKFRPTVTVVGDPTICVKCAVMIGAETEPES